VGNNLDTKNIVQLVPNAAPAGPSKPPDKISIAGLKFKSEAMTVGPLTVV